MNVSRQTLYTALVISAALTFSLAFVSLFVRQIPVGLIMGSGAITSYLGFRYTEKRKWDSPDSP